MGYIFVFDMDQTLAGDYVYPSITSRNISQIQLNPELMKLLDMMNKGRSKGDGSVDAIFLFTNNSDIDYINLVISAIEAVIPGFEFDDVMSCRDRRRADKTNTFSPKKFLKDVETMLKGKDISTENLHERVFFFDDIPDHAIRGEILSQNYIQIMPPYSASERFDVTDYSSVKRVLKEIGVYRENVSGGKRITRRKRRLNKNKKWSTRRLRKPGPKRSHNAF